MHLVGSSLDHTASKGKRAFGKCEAQQLLKEATSNKGHRY